VALLGSGINTEGRQVVLLKILCLIVADDHEHVGVPGMQPVMQDFEGLDHTLLVILVPTEPIILAEFFQELDRRLIMRYTGKDALSTLGPYLRGSQDNRSVGAP
jgi:hypothetical protein